MSAKFVVLTYHRVRPQTDPLSPDMCDVPRFESQLATMSRWFNVMPLAEAVRRSQSGDLPQRTVCITFDDGYRDNVDIALPMLRKYGLHATFFIATGYLGDGIMWNDQVIETVRRRETGDWDLSEFGLGVRPMSDVESRRQVMRELIAKLKHQTPVQRQQWADTLAQQITEPMERIMMTRDEVRSLHDAGMAIGGHTVTHPILSLLDAPEARAELANGKQALEVLTDSEIELFAFPNGKAGADYESQHADLARDVGFSAAFTTMWGHATDTSPKFELPRVGLEWDSGWRFGARLLKCFYEAQDVSSMVSVAA